MSWLLLLLVFGFGAFAAYRDIDDFFTTKNVGHLALRHWPTRGFLWGEPAAGRSRLMKSHTDSEAT